MKAKQSTSPHRDFPVSVNGTITTLNLKVTFAPTFSSPYQIPLMFKSFIHSKNICCTSTVYFSLWLNTHNIKLIILTMPKCTVQWH